MKKLWLTLGAVAAFICGYGAVADAYPSGGMYGRGEWRGYFTNTLDTAGSNVLPANYSGEAFPSSINTATEFINFIFNKLDSGTVQERTGAAFIINTMLNIQGSASDKTPSSAWRTKWSNMVRTAANHGHVNWRVSFSYTINSYYQGNGDDAFYDNSGTFPSMVFEDEFGRPAYAIKWQCANPINDFTPTLESPWDIEGRSTVTNSAGDNSQNFGGQINTYVGDTLTWRHYVRNVTTDAFTNPTTVDAWSAQNLNGGAFTIISPSRDTGTYTASQEKLVITDAAYIVPNLPVGTNICRVVFFNPDSSWVSADERGPGHCARVQASFDLAPSVEVRINGGSVPGNRAEPGDTITFTYTVNNSGGVSSNTACTIYGLSRNGYYAVPTPADSTSDVGFVQPGHGCPRNFSPGPTTLVTETVPAASVVVNRSICRSLYVDPPSPGAPPLGFEACAYVVHKPYTRVYGGDVVTGMGFESSPNTCTTFADSAVIGWNRGSANAWAGAGVQQAARATGVIYDFATSLGGGAGPPIALSFTNTATDALNRQFGGVFDHAPCVPNFYADRPASTSGIPANVDGMNDGIIYGGSGSIPIGGGTLTAGEQITVYVAGNVLITGNISYGGSWSASDTPLFRLVVRGDIYIDRTVTRLDGLYIAQPNGSSQGVIYTCANGTFSEPDLDDTLYTDCGSKLTVNGAFIATHLHLLRTNGTVRQSNAGEAGSSPNIAEVFNYSPVMWILQPPDSGEGARYDSITSLPPVL